MTTTADGSASATPLVAGDVGDGVLDLIDEEHERGLLQLVPEPPQLHDHALGVFGLEARRQPAEELLLVTRE
jgi:hypothetical protein